MLILGRGSIDRVLRRHASARVPVDRWTRIASCAEWRDIIEVRHSLQTADLIKGTDLTCFNIGGNSYRLLVRILYARQEIVLRELLTHSEYTKKYVR